MAENQRSHLRDGYVHEAAFDSGKLQVDSIHAIYYEQYGRKDGLPVVFLHGGPGVSISYPNTKFFDPKVYRVVLLDQRGCGKSTPRDETTDNSAPHLAADIEKIREHLGIEQWHMVFAGSWGSTLGILYVQTYPGRTKCLVLRGVCAWRKEELLHTHGGPDGAARFFPDLWEKFIGYLPEDERHDILGAYHRRLFSEDPELVAEAAREWNRWEIGLGTAQFDPTAFAILDDQEWSVTHARLESHYAMTGGGMEDGQILAPSNMAKMKDLPGAIVQGRRDLVTPPKTAWQVHKAWPKSSLTFVDDAGHNSTEPGTFSKLVEVCDEFAQLK